MRELSINVDHVATLREARKERFPSPVHAAVIAELAGASGITCHLRHDRRHIKEQDVENLKRIVKGELNLEMAATQEMVKTALKIKPHQVTLVPERPEEVTTEGGLNLKKVEKDIIPIIKNLKEAGIRVSIFIEPRKDIIKIAKRIGAQRIELNTDLYSKEKEKRDKHLHTLKEAAKYGKRLGLSVHAGHGIDYENIIPLLSIKEISGFSIGFSIVSRALFVGFERAVKEMVEIINSKEGR